jgi:hypothetical protein
VCLVFGPLWGPWFWVRFGGLPWAAFLLAAVGFLPAAVWGFLGVFFGLAPPLRFRMRFAY